MLNVSARRGQWSCISQTHETCQPFENMTGALEQLLTAKRIAMMVAWLSLIQMPIRLYLQGLSKRKLRFRQHAQGRLSESLAVSNCQWMLGTSHNTSFCQFILHSNNNNMSNNTKPDLPSCARTPQHVEERSHVVLKELPQIRDRGCKIREYASCENCQQFRDQSYIT